MVTPSSLEYSIFVLFIATCKSRADVPFSNSSSNIDVQVIGKSKVQTVTLNAGRVKVLHADLDISDASDLQRVTIEIINPAEYHIFGQDPILEVMCSNGRGMFTLRLPVVVGDELFYTDGKILEPTLPQDYGIKKRKHNKDHAQSLVITAQSRLNLDIEFKLSLSKLDRSQYEVRFGKGNTSKVLNNQHLTYVKPMGFHVNTKNQAIDSLLLTITSDDDICGTVVTIPREQYLYQPLLDLRENAVVGRKLAFSRRADVFFPPDEISSEGEVFIYVFINLDDTACDPEATPREHTLLNKVVSFEFSKVTTESYWTPIALMMLLFVVPCVLFVASSSVGIIRTCSLGDGTPDLIDLRSDSSLESPISKDRGDVHLNETYNTDTSYAEDANQETAESTAEVYRYPVAILIPAFMHMAVEYHKWHVSSSANRDEMCFHNHACSHPYGQLRSLNNIVSNMGYVIFGLLFVAVTSSRHNKKRSSFGVHSSKQLDITIGVLLIMQALASATYHICPSDVAFQFDTPFIQIICGLLVIRQYLIRRKPLSPSLCNWVLVVVLVVNFIVSALPKSWIAVYFLASVHVLLTTSICFHKRRAVYNYISTDNTMEVAKVRQANVFCSLFVLLNLAFLSIYTFSNRIHVNQIAVYICILNAVLYMIYYTALKVFYDENLYVKAVIYGVIALIFWIAAVSCFLMDATDWTKTSAQSRALNRPCVLMSFFDTHDLWHIASSFSVFFTFLFISHIDDDLANVPRVNINVF